MYVEKEARKYYKIRYFLLIWFLVPFYIFCTEHVKFEAWKRECGRPRLSCVVKPPRITEGLQWAGQGRSRPTLHISVGIGNARLLWGEKHSQNYRNSFISCLKPFLKWGGVWWNRNVSSGNILELSNWQQDETRISSWWSDKIKVDFAFLL